MKNKPGIFSPESRLFLYILISILFLVFMPFDSESAKMRTDTPATFPVAKLIQVKDGDTIVFDIKIWADLTKRVTIRLLGVDTPELRKYGKRHVPECEKEWGQRAKQATRLWLAKNPSVYLTDIKIDKFGGRHDARVVSIFGGGLGEHLISENMARLYPGKGVIRPWCQDLL